MYSCCPLLSCMTVRLWARRTWSVQKTGQTPTATSNRRMTSVATFSSQRPRPTVAASRTRRSRGRCGRLCLAVAQPGAVVSLTAHVSKGRLDYCVDSDAMTSTVSTIQTLNDVARPWAAVLTRCWRLGREGQLARSLPRRGAHGRALGTQRRPRLQPGWRSLDLHR